LLEGYRVIRLNILAVTISSLFISVSFGSKQAILRRLTGRLQVPPSTRSR
jgi:hypothetical protein